MRWGPNGPYELKPFIPWKEPKKWCSKCRIYYDVEVYNGISGIWVEEAPKHRCDPIRLLLFKGDGE